MLGTAGFSRLLQDWLPHQRWYAGKGRVIRAVEVASATELVAGDPALHHLVVAVEAGSGPEHYQLLVGVRSQLPQRLDHVLIGALGDHVAYDAAHDPDLTRYLLRH